MPCFDHAVLLKATAQHGRLSTTVLYRGLEKNGITSVNQTRPHCVDQMGKTHSEPLAARHGRGTAWSRHGHGMLRVNRLYSDRGKIFSCLQNIPNTPGPTHHLIQWWKNRLWRDFGHSHPPSAEVKNEWSCTFTAPLYDLTVWTGTASAIHGVMSCTLHFMCLWLVLRETISSLQRKQRKFQRGYEVLW